MVNISTSINRTNNHQTQLKWLRRHDDGIPGPGLGQAHKFSGIKTSRIRGIYYSSYMYSDEHKHDCHLI